MDLTEDKIKELTEAFVAISTSSDTSMASGGTGPCPLEQKTRAACGDTPGGH